MDEAQGVKEYDEFRTVARSATTTSPHWAPVASGLKGGAVLDLGCGSGRLAHDRPDARITGLDLSEPMLETGRATPKGEGLTQRDELRRCDIASFDAELADRVDVVSCNFALHHLPTEQTAGCLSDAGPGAKARLLADGHNPDYSPDGSKSSTRRASAVGGRMRSR